MSKWFSSFTLTRVSSAAMKSACASVSTARGEKSPRLPMGVATRYNIPAIGSLPPVSEIDAAQLLGFAAVFVL